MRPTCGNPDIQDSRIAPWKPLPITPSGAGPLPRFALYPSFFLFFRARFAGSRGSALGLNSISPSSLVMKLTTSPGLRPSSARTWAGTVICPLVPTRASNKTLTVSPFLAPVKIENGDCTQCGECSLPIWNFTSRTCRTHVPIFAPASQRPPCAPAAGRGGILGRRSPPAARA